MATELAQIDSRLDVLLTRQAQPSVSPAQSNLSTVIATSTPTTSSTATTRPTNTPLPSPTPFAQALPSQVLFRIVPEESEARYIVDEIEPPRKGLVGRTNQVAGDIIVDFDNPSNSRIGVIRINLRTLHTDEPARDGTVRSQVLLSARPEYEFTDFAPKEIKGLPAKITLGQAITFQVTGDLPLRGVTRSVTFSVTVTPISHEEIKGIAHTTILRDDYGLLQSPLADHGVSKQIILELEFVARAVSV
jgi:polyisoprenoid-binding protein YceI